MSKRLISVCIAAVLLAASAGISVAFSLQPNAQAKARRGANVTAGEKYQAEADAMMQAIAFQDVTVATTEAPTTQPTEPETQAAAETEASVQAAAIETAATEAETAAPETEAATGPETTAPETEAAAEPETTAPETEAATEPETTVPETEAATEPETTVPETEAATEPETTAPETEAATEPETTVPETEAATEPEATAPETEAATEPETEAATEPETEAATEPPAKAVKIYTIDEDALAAPVPNPACYGEADSPAELGWLIEKAEPLLDGQTLFFNTERQLHPETKVHYYLDDSILAITWKETLDRSVFTYSEIKLLHPSQFRRYLSGGEFGSGIQSRTSEMAQDVNAVVACSADFYAYRRQGVSVTNGIVNKANAGIKDGCYIDYNGDLILERGLAFDGIDDLQEYVDENNINFSLSFGPILVQNGENVCPKNYGLGESQNVFPRSAICQMGNLHYLYVASNMENHYWAVFTTYDFAKYVADTGCISAYGLDGGQTTTVVMNNEVINYVNYGSERYISDIIYFATAIPSGE